MKFYMDEHVDGAITSALRKRGVDVLTVQEDNRTGTADVQVLDRAIELERVLFTRDKDFLRETSIRQRFGREFFGAIYAKQHDVSIAQCISDLELLAVASVSHDEYRNRLVHLPIR